MEEIRLNTHEMSMRRRAKITGKVQAENIRHGIKEMREI
jgi:hypothetical protein